MPQGAGMHLLPVLPETAAFMRGRHFSCKKALPPQAAIWPESASISR